MTESPAANFLAKACSVLFAPTFSTPLLAAKITVSDEERTVETVGDRVTLVADEETAGLVPFAVLVAVTKQLPALWALSEVPLIAHPVAVPFEAMNVKAPPLESPLVCRVRGVLT